MEHPACSILDAMPPAVRSNLLERSVPRRLSAGEFLFVTGDRATRVHVVCTGLLKLVGAGATGDDTIIHLAVPGEIVGEVAALDDLPHSVDAIAASDCFLIGLDADEFVRGATSHPDAALELMGLLARRTRWITDTTLERSIFEVPARLAGRLLDLADLVGRVDAGAIELDLPLAQQDIGKLSGMCRESASKTMARFRKNGWIDYRRRTLRVLRPDMLERIRCAGRASRPSP